MSISVAVVRRTSKKATRARRPGLRTRRLKMRKLKIVEHISLDGVIQHSADNDDFPYSGWSVPYRSDAGRDAIFAAYGERFDVLLGRRTYDSFSSYWPKAPSGPMAD